METQDDLMPADNTHPLRNILWAYPYLVVMGMIWGYLAAAVSGVIIGILIAAVVSVIISKAGKL